MIKPYTVSQDKKSGMWYAHLEGFSYVPYFKSFCEKKSEAIEYVKMLNGLPHNVERIERARSQKNKIK